MRPVDYGRILPATLLVVCSAVCALVAEITPMTRERFAEALEAGGKTDGDDLIIYKDVCRTRSGPGAQAFDVVISTPFGLVADTVFESRKRGEPFDPAGTSVAPPGKQSVIVSVDPVYLFGKEHTGAPPLGVRSVILRRGMQLTEPLRADTHDVRFPDLGQAYRGGAFYFPLETFSSAKGDLEIVVIPEKETTGVEAVLVLKKAALAKMR